MCAVFVIGRNGSQEGYIMKTKKVDSMLLAQLALLIAIEIIMKLSGLGSVPVGPLYMSFLTLPIAVGAMMIGPVGGVVLGAVFGILSYWDAITGGSVMGSVLFQISPIHSFILCIVTRVLMGLCTGYIFKAVRKVDKTKTWSYFVGAVSAPLLNTLFFMTTLIACFWNTDVIQAWAASIPGATNVFLFAVLSVGVNFIVEAIVCTIVGAAVAKAVDRYVNKASASTRSIVEAGEDPVEEVTEAELIGTRRNDHPWKRSRTFISNIKRSSTTCSLAA